MYDSRDNFIFGFLCFV